MGKGSSSESGSTRSSRFRFLSWSPETHVMREFLAAFPLPRVVRLTNGDEATLLRSLGVLPPDVEPSQPLLFYRKYKPTKVLAKSLKVTANKGGKWKETGGPPLLIPDSFPGMILSFYHMRRTFETDLHTFKACQKYAKSLIVQYIYDFQPLIIAMNNRN